MTATTTHPGNTCQRTWSTGTACAARCAITTSHQCTVDRATHGTEHVCCCGNTAAAAACRHCHDDPPTGHRCPACGATTERSTTDA